MQDLVTYSACAEVLPSPAMFHPRKLKEALQLSEKARFGQTEVGSFIATLYFPVPMPAEQQQLLFPSPPESLPPVERRVTARIVRGLASVASATATKDPTILTSSYTDGFSSNMCEALSSLFSAFPGGKCTFSSNFDPIHPLPAGVPTGSITIADDAMPVLDEAAERMQPTEPPRLEILDGYVTTLHHSWGGNDSESEGHDEAEIYRIWLVWNDRGTMRTVQFDLDQVAHTKAVHAYQKKLRVKVAGRLERRGKRWVLFEPKDFQVDQTP